MTMRWIGLAVLVSLLPTKRAQACSPIAEQPWAVPGDGLTVPANLPAVAQSSFGGWPRQFALASTDGEQVPLSVESAPDALLARLQTPLRAGTRYTLSWGHTSPAIEHRFVATAAAPLPTTLGRVTTRVSRAAVDIPGGAECATKLDAAVADLTIDPSPELRPWMAVTRFRTAVDGVAWAHSLYGRTTPPDQPYSMGERSPTQVFASCTGGSGLALGRHEVSITAEVAGFDTYPRTTFQIDLRCTADVDDSVTGRGGCACTAATARNGSGGPTWLLALSAAICARRRRRKRTAGRAREVL